MYLQITLLNKVYQFKVHCFILSTAPQVFTRVLSLLVSEWANEQGICLLWYLDDWLTIADTVPHLLEQLELLLNLRNDLGYIHLGENKPRANQQGLESRKLIGSIQGYPVDPRIVRFRGVLDNFLCLISPSEDVAAGPRPRSFSEMIHSEGHGQGGPPSLVIEVTLVSSHRQHCNSSPLVRGVFAVYLVIATGGEMGIWSPSPGAPSISSFHKCVEDWLGEHLQDLTTAGI